MSTMVAESNNETATEYPENGKPGLKKKKPPSPRKRITMERGKMMSSRAAEDVLQREGNTKKNTIGKKMKVSKSMSSILAIVLPKQL